MRHPTQTRKFVRIVVMNLFCVPGMITAANTVQAPGSGGPYRIAGVVVSKTDGNALARARIVVRDVKNSDKFESMITAEDGKFEFTGVPAGKYSLSGAKRGFISAAYDQHDGYSTALVTGAGVDTENLILKLSPDALISGAVFDEAGDPVRHASVTLYFEDHRDGIDQIHMSRGAQTDDLGAYELTGLIPGTYFIAASGRPWYAIHPPSDHNQSGSKQSSSSTPAFDRSLDVAYPVTYFADVIDADSATPIVVRGGEHVQLDIHLNPVPSLHLVFHLPADRRNGFSFPRLETPTFDGSAYAQTSFARIGTGDWEITGIPAGRYNIQFPGSGSSPGSQLDGVNLTKDGQEIDASAAQSFSTVKVSVQFSGEPAVPKGIAIGLRAKSRTRDRWHNVDSKGSVEFEQISPGKYELVVAGSGKRYSISQLIADSAEVSGHVINIAAGALLSLSVTVTAGSVDVQGTVKRAGKPFAGAMVVLIPKDPQSNHDLFRRDQSDLDGTFDLRGVVPGSYSVVAIENGWDLNWAEPDVIAGYAKHGQKIQVGAQSGPLNLPDIRLQSR